VQKLILVAAAMLVCSMVSGCRDSNAEAEKKKLAESEKAKQAILRVLRADQQLGKKRDLLPPKSTPSQIAWAVGKYCDDLEKLEMGDCPADFRVAYRAHIGAWRETQAAIKELPEGPLEAILVGAINGLFRGERDGGTARLEGSLKRSLDRVRDTWIEVEKTGARYDAAL